MSNNKVHFAKWVGGNDPHFLTSCGKRNPANHVFFRYEASEAGRLMRSITCKKCMALTTLRDLVSY